MTKPTSLVAKATHQATRVHNERLVLGIIYDAGPVSRADVARVTGLTRTTVSQVVDRLLESGFAREVGRGPSTGGKAPILLEVADDARLLVGVDLGETRFHGALVNLRGEVRHSLEVPVEDRDGDRALDAAYCLVEELSASAHSPLAGIGIGTPGIVDTESGTVIRSVNLDWRDLPLGDLVRERFGLPTYVANDSQAAALGEYVFGGASGPNLIAIKVGLGIGAGIILNGSLFQGDGFGAGEIGHVTVVLNGLACRCGRRGCLETVASTRAVVARIVRERAELPAPSFDEIVAAYLAGDALVVRAVDEAGAALGSAVAGLIGALNVRRIVLTGSMSRFGDGWLEAVRRAATQHSLAVLAAGTEIEIGQLGEDIVTLGASALLLTRELGFSLTGLLMAEVVDARAVADRARAADARSGGLPAAEASSAGVRAAAGSLT
ncbi:MAG TPA: ROK family transcriptional regulator [Candidatus Limnocylindrales bacterium]